MPERLTIVKEDGYTRIVISDPWQGANGIRNEYVLLKDGFPLPDGTDSTGVIFVPIKSIVCMSTTHIAMIEALGKEKSISGISGTGFVYSGAVREMIDSGLISETGYEGSLNNELLLKIKPDLIMMYGIGDESAGQAARLEDLGIRVMINADYLETDPLRKLGWIRLFGHLFDEEELADSIVACETEQYNNIREQLMQSKIRKPKVLLGLPFRDTWYISPGNSFASQLISDAGGEYIWNDTRSAVSMPMPLEHVFVKGLKADFWLNTGTASTRAEILAIDSRLGELRCFSDEKLYNNNRRVSQGGGNDYWESGAVHPSLILKDIAAILHPEIFGDQEPVYYRKVN